MSSIRQPDQRPVRNGGYFRTPNTALSLSKTTLENNKNKEKKVSYAATAQQDLLNLAVSANVRGVTSLMGWK